MELSVLYICTLPVQLLIRHHRNIHRFHSKYLSLGKQKQRLSHCFWPAGLLPCFFENAQLSYVVQNATVLPVLNQDSGYYTVYINHTYSSWFDATCYLHFSFLEHVIRDKQWPDGFLKTGLIWSIYWLVKGILHENKGLKPQKELQHYFFYLNL